MCLGWLTGTSYTWNLGADVFLDTYYFLEIQVDDGTVFGGNNALDFSIQLRTTPDVATTTITGPGFTSTTTTTKTVSTPGFTLVLMKLVKLNKVHNRSFNLN